MKGGKVCHFSPQLFDQAGRDSLLLHILVALYLVQQLNIHIVPTLFIAAQVFGPGMAADGIHKTVHIGDFVLPAQGIG